MDKSLVYCFLDYGVLTVLLQTINGQLVNPGDLNW